MKKISNFSEAVKELTDILVELEEDHRGYQTDIYLYYDEETGTATLDTFENVGGRSWLGDDHYTIYQHKGFFEDWLQWYEEIDEFAGCLEIDYDDFIKEVKKYVADSEDDPDDYVITYWDCYEYVKTIPQYVEQLRKVFCEAIEEHRPEFMIEAERILREFEENN